MNSPFLEKIIKNKETRETIMWVLIFSISALSLFTIGWVIYRFFFWEPYVEPLAINLTNLTK